MHINISLDTDNLTLADADFLSILAGAIRGAFGTQQPQPEVGDNTGTSSTGLILSPGAVGVSEGVDAAAAAPASAPEKTAEPEKRKPGRPKKEVAPAQAGEPQVAGANSAETQTGSSAGCGAADTTATATTASRTDAPAQTVTLTLDDVRAKLQAFTGANGIDAGLALLQEFGAGRVSELKTEHYTAFTSKCEVK